VLNHKKIYIDSININFENLRLLGIIR